MAKKTTTAKKTTAPAQDPATQAASKSDGVANAKSASKAFFYVLYVDCYIDDKTILKRGVYQTKKKIERLDSQRDVHCAKFEGKIPQIVLHQLADSLKVTLVDADGDYRADKDILAEIVQEF